MQFPVYRALCLPDFTRSSLCAGGGDAFGESTFSSELAFAGVGTSRHYADVAVIDSGASSHHFGNIEHLSARRPAHVITTLGDGTKVNIGTKGDVVLPSEDAQDNPLEPLILKDVSLFKGSPINLVFVSMICNENASFHFSKGNSYFGYKGHRQGLIERDCLYVPRLDEVLPAEDLAWLRQCEQPLGNCRDIEEHAMFGTSLGPKQKTGFICAGSSERSCQKRTPPVMLYSS